MQRNTGLTTRRFTACAIYTRQSASSNDDLSSCEIQYRACAAYVQSMRELGWLLVAERFDDDGYSGATLDRPALARLRELVARRQIGIVVVYRMDRLARSLIRSASLLEEFREHDVQLVIVTAPELGDAAGDRLMLNILGSFAEFEREMIASRIAESRARLKARGQRIAGAVPFGYATDLRTKQLVPLPEEAEIVKWMFSQSAAGHVPADIAEQANEKGSKTKVKAEGRYIPKFGGNPWTARQVLATLRNPVYTGGFRSGAGTRPGCHEPLITRELFERVGLQLDSRRTRASDAVSYGDIWPLKGLILCAVCDRPMTPHTVRHGRITYCYYRCRSTAGGRKPCRGQVSAGQIEAAVCRKIPLPKPVDGRNYINLREIPEYVEKLSYDHRTKNIRLLLKPQSEPPEESQ